MVSAANLVAAGWAAAQPFDFSYDRSHNPFHVPENLGVREPKHDIPPRPQPRVAPPIHFRFAIVRNAVALDYQRKLAAQEVREERTDRHLATEFGSSLRAAKILPQKPLGRCRRVAKLARPGGVAFGLNWHTHFLPTPDPSRKREGHFGRAIPRVTMADDRKSYLLSYTASRA